MVQNLGNSSGRKNPFGLSLSKPLSFPDARSEEEQGFDRLRPNGF
jgi:hypothetical protein